MTMLDDGRFGEGVVFGLGFALAVVGFLRITIGPLPEDWTIIPTGLVLCAISLGARWLNTRRIGGRAKGGDE